MTPVHPDPNPAQLLRFGLRPRIEHLAIVLLFVVLALTGLPQKYYGAHLAQAVVAWFGSIHALRAVHRAAGFALCALAVEHLAAAVWLFAQGRTSMVPGRKDFRDAVDSVRYWLGLSAGPPRMDRYDYRQKFDYWALGFAVLVMIASGLVLLFPQQVAALLPGSVVAAAKVAHSNEALLALLTVVIWHAYSAVLRPEVFPLDRSILTGRISRERLQREHPLEYERLMAREASENAGR